jgi:hypothetical protein
VGISFKAIFAIRYVRSALLGGSELRTLTPYLNNISFCSHVCLALVSFGKVVLNTASQSSVFFFVGYPRKTIHVEITHAKWERSFSSKQL